MLWFSIPLEELDGKDDDDGSTLLKKPSNTG